MKQAYLFMNQGGRAGNRFSLVNQKINQVGRGLDCEVVLNDAQCSRVHATLEFIEDQWYILDNESRNGTFVNGNAIEKQVLADSDEIRMGETFFTFCIRRGKTSMTYDKEKVTKQTRILEQNVQPSDTANFAFSILRDHKTSADIFYVFELSLRLLSIDDPDEVIEVCLKSIKERVDSQVAGFLWTNDDGHLTPQMVIPPDADKKIRLDQSLTELVSREHKAIRMNHRDESSDKEDAFADSICAPLVRGEKTLGAIHLYKENDEFKEHDLRLSQTVADIMVRSLIRAREHISLVAEHRQLRNKTASSETLIGESAPMQDLSRRIGKVANATGCVLVRGESGAGKELVSRAIHKASPRADRPLLCVNCAAIPSELMESQLFGHKKGAFTSADRDHIGWFEQADTGTLFLDEVGELTLEGQAKLLRILEGHPFLPVGATEEIRVDVRVICATNRDLKEFVAERRFREDLYYRLSVFEILVPPLRDRGKDIEILIHHFLTHFKKQNGRPKLRFSDKALHQMIGYNWPGNVRQLRNVIDSAVVMADGNVIRPKDLGISRGEPGAGEESLKLADWEKKLIVDAMDRSDGNVQAAANMLGVSRATLYRKIEEYKIPRK